MSDGLSVIRRIAGLPTPVQASGADAVEAAVLTQSLQALNALPRMQPDADVLASIAACAADASDLETLAAVRGACGLGPVQESVEGAVLSQSLAALDALPVTLPSPEAHEAVAMRAQEATNAPVLAASGEAPAPDSPETALLAQSLDALNALPTYAPSPEALATILAHAAEASQTASGATEDVGAEIARQSEAALDTLPTYSPSPEALAAVLAHAAEASEQSSDVESTVEAEIARQSEAALDTLPEYAPSPEALAAVLAHAQEATFAPLFSASGEGEVAGVEAEMLRQSLRALDTLPAYAPSAEVLSAVEGAALNATFAPLHAAYGEGTSETPEAPLLAQSREALDTLPAYAPSDAAFAAVLAAAATASGATLQTAAAPAAPALRQKRASDRAAVRSARPRRARGIVAGIATLAVVMIAAVTILDPGLGFGVGSEEAEMVASVELDDAAPAPAPPRALLPPTVAEEAEPLAAALQDPVPTVARTAPRGPSASAPPPSSFQAVAQRSAPAPQPSAPLAPEADALAAADLAMAGDAATDWEAGEDIRLLSLRLKQLREQNSGLEWDEASVAFETSGAPLGTTPGVQAVRETVPLGRARIRTSSPVTDR